MRRRREISLFSISFLDLLSGALGAVIILYVALPKSKPVEEIPVNNMEKVILEGQLQSRQKEIQSLEKMLSEASAKIKELEAKLSSVPKEEPKPSPATDLDVGFKFKGKDLVFIIDTSYSMTEEDRMGGVKAGLKMLLTSLSGSYYVDVVQFPNGTRSPFRTLWGTIKKTNSKNKSAAMEFIYSLKPNGGTPTREVLLHVLRNYADLTDIVLLTDGAPSLHNSNKKDDAEDILRTVQSANRRKVQINTIGVGSHIIRDQESEEYQFLKKLSEQNNGFFVGF
jgi:hypothetical protein